MTYTLVSTSMAQMVAIYNQQGHSRSKEITLAIFHFSLSIFKAEISLQKDITFIKLTSGVNNLHITDPPTPSYPWRCPWCNGYRRRKWTRRHEFKSWTRLISFHIALIPLGKVWIQLFSLQLWVNSRTD